MARFSVHYPKLLLQLFAYLYAFIIMISFSALNKDSQDLLKLKGFFRNDIREDGRNFSDRRNYKVHRGLYSSRTTSSQWKAQGRDNSSSRVFGSSQVHIGSTMVVSGVNLLIGTPSTMMPDSGDIVFEIDLQPMASSKYEQRNSKHEDAYELEGFLRSSISTVLDLHQLCVLKDVAAFRLKVSVSVICDRGNLKDATLLAVMYALQDTRLPEPDFSRDELYFHQDRTRALQLRAFAVPVSVLLYEGRWLVDPSDSEEKTLVGSAACVALTCVFAAASGALLFLQQSAGSGGLTAEELQEAVAVCRAHNLDISAI